MRKIIVTKGNEVKTFQPDFHQKVFVKELVNPKLGSRFLQFRITKINPGGGDKYHSHPNSEQIIYVLKGKGKIEVERKIYPLSKDALVFIPPGVRHHVKNDSKVPLHFVILWAPPANPIDWIPKNK